MKNKALEQYLRELKKALCCPHRERSGLLSQGESLLENFLEENPEADYEAFVDAFGPPEMFAGEMLDTLDRETLKRAQAGQKWLLRGVAALVAVSLIIPAAFWFAGQHKAKPDSVISVTPSVTPTEVPSPSPIQPNPSTPVESDIPPTESQVPPEGNEIPPETGLASSRYVVMIPENTLKELVELVGSERLKDLFGWDVIPTESNAP